MVFTCTVTVFHKDVTANQLGTCALHGSSSGSEASSEASSAISSSEGSELPASEDNTDIVTVARSE